MAQTKSKTESAANTAYTVTSLEVPAAVRDFAEKGVAQAKDAYTKFKVVADETSDMVEGVYSTAARGASTLGQKALKTAKENTDASFDHLISLFNVRTLSDAIELQTAFVRKQSEAMALQAREFAELAQSVCAEAVSPVKAQFEKTLKFPG
jgi:phasin